MHCRYFAISIIKSNRFNSTPHLSCVCACVCVWELRLSFTAAGTDAFSAFNHMKNGHLQFQSLPGEVWKAAGRSPEPNQPNAIITPQADREGGNGRRWGEEDGESEGIQNEIEGRWMGVMGKERHEVKDGDRDNRWGWIGWDGGGERLRDVSVTADCADIDPSLVLSP